MYLDTVNKKFNGLIGKADSVILGIESSCDETAAAIVVGGRRVLSSVVSSQIDIHQRFGGVVPEVASRNHTLALPAIVDQALAKANLKLGDIDAIGVTYGAGLIGALLVGVSSAKALALAANLPLIAVNHIQAHIAVNYVEFPWLEPPFLALVASGGHTAILNITGFNEHQLIGTTMDDAIGESFDKVARLLGLPYPGGVVIDRLSKSGSANINFFKNVKKVRSDYSLSYSGLKTAVVNYVHNARQKNEDIITEDVCASFNKCAVDLLADTTMQAAKNYDAKRLVLAGGVAANSYLRSCLAARGASAGVEVLYPRLEYCTDNAIMVATRAHFSAFYGENQAGLDLNATSNLPL